MLIKIIGIALFFVISFFLVFELSKLKDKKAKPILDIRQTMCLGTCPVYSATIYEDGSVYYVGEQFVDHIGPKRFVLDIDTTKTIIEKINDLDIEYLKSEYDGNITDLPSTYLTFYNTDIIKIRARYGIPKKLNNFINYISKLVLQ